MTTKPGWRTSEFWVTTSTILGAALTAAAGRLDGRVAAVVAGFGAAAYAYSRGQAKSGGSGATATAITEAKGPPDVPAV